MSHNHNQKENQPRAATQAYIAVCPKCKREGTWGKREGFHLLGKYHCSHCKSNFNNPEEMAQGTTISLRKESKEYKSDTHNTRHKGGIFDMLRASKPKSKGRRKKNGIRLF